MQVFSFPPLDYYLVLYLWQLLDNSYIFVDVTVSPPREDCDPIFYLFFGGY